MSVVVPEGFQVLPGLLKPDEIGRLRSAGALGRWSVVMWVKTGGYKSAC